MMSVTSAQTILGIDIGTSSVKCSIVQVRSQESFSILASGKCSYDPVRIKRSSNPAHSQQCVREIFQCLGQALAAVSQHSVDLIAICGQMHGVVLWNQEMLFTKQNELNFDAISDQYDWTDGRCDAAFLSTLPAPDCHADTISSGYGTATIFWLCKHEPELLRRFNRAATIMDFFAVVLCRLDEAKTSLQNAHNWGYFDPESGSWNGDLLKASGFPIELLPTIVPLNGIVGHSVDFCNKIPNCVPVMIPYGDLQAIMTLAFMNQEDALVFNMGTSAQLCRLEPVGFKPPRKSTSPRRAVECFPFDANRYLSVAAGLNGGNVLRSYSTFLQDITRQLTGVELTEAELWSKLNVICAGESKQSTMRVQPTLFGERHEPEVDLRITGVRFQMPSLAELTQKLCSGLVENLLEMMQLTESEKATISTIVCTGNVLVKNTVLQSALKKVVRREGKDFEVKVLDSCDADVGCAVLAYRQCSESGHFAK